MALKVLIVEDEMIIALELKNSLRLLGYDVLAIINDGAEAVESIDKIDPDLIMMDINIPGEFNGLEAGEIINKVYDIPIIFCTAYSEEEVAKQISSIGKCGYLIKPYDDFVLKEKIDQILHN